MTCNAYFGSVMDGWYNLTDEWGIVGPFFVLPEWRFHMLTRGLGVRSSTGWVGTR